MPTQKQIEAGIPVVHQFVMDNVPSFFKGSADGYLNDHPQLSHQLVVAIYEAMEKAK